jgi:predicted PurR-regulated permease PerM
MLEEPEQNQETDQIAEPSPTWDRSVKLLVAVVTLVAVVAVAVTFTDLILRIVAAAIIAYVMTPLIHFLTERTPLGRGASILVTYLLVAFLLLGAVVTLGVSTFRQIGSLINSIPDLVENVLEWLSTTAVVIIGPLQFDVAAIWGSLDWASIEDQVIATILPAVNQSGRTVVVILSSTVNVLTVIFFIFIVSIYLAFEMGRLGGYISGSIYQEGFRRDTERMLREFDRIWRAYLRGQIVLAFIIFLAVWISLSILGVQNAFGLGVLSGLLEFLPVIGPFIGTAAAALVAFFQPTNYLGLDPVIFALVVIGVMIIIQQIENNILVPRIVGGALDLHPLVVIIGVFMAASQVGLIGAILAAPVMATAKLIGTYAWRKMFDLPPFPGPEKVPKPVESNLLRRLKGLRTRLKKPTEPDE